MSDRGRLVIAAVTGILFLLLPFVDFLSRNHADPSLIPADYIRFCLVNLSYILAAATALGVVLFWLVGKRLYKFWQRYLISVAVLFFLSFTYDAFYNGLLGPKGANGLSAALHGGLILLLAAVVFKASKHTPVVLAAFAFVTANIGLALPVVLETVAAAAQTGSVHSVGAYTNNKPKDRQHNVYYVILDAYPSARTLQQVFAFDNTAFIAAMEENGFYHASETYSSYNQTTLTLTSIMTGDYFNTDDKDALKSERRYPRLLTGVHVPPTVAAVKEAGYEFYVIGNNWGRCAGPHVSCYDSARDDSYLSHAFWSATPVKVLISTKKKPTKKSGRPDVDAIGKLSDRLRRFGAPTSPTFTFVHHLSPHPPYIFKENCTQRSSYKVDFGLWSSPARPLFLDNLKCTNSKVLELTKQLSSHDPSAIIVFQSDHGSAFTVEWNKPYEHWSPVSILERSTILNLIKMPDQCSRWLSPNMNNVNTMRAVLACINGREPQFLANKSYIARYSKNDQTLGKVDITTNQALPIN